jgi:hypothetical protein
MGFPGEQGPRGPQGPPGPGGGITLPFGCSEFFLHVESIEVAGVFGTRTVEVLAC